MRFIILVKPRESILFFSAHLKNVNYRMNHNIYKVYNFRAHFILDKSHGHVDHSLNWMTKPENMIAF